MHQIIDRALPSSTDDAEAPAPSDAPSGAGTDAHRPRYHFWSRGTRIQAPGALVRMGDVYHLFPLMDGHWGHAVSPDLVHWTDQTSDAAPLAAGPGSVVVDHYDRSGLFEGRSGLVAVYADPVSDAVRLAWSADEGRSWNILDEPLVIDARARRDGVGRLGDPHVARDMDHDQWVMVTASENHLHFFVSSDLRHWTPSADGGRAAFGGDQWHEGGAMRFPDFFPLRVEATHVTKWVLWWSTASAPSTNGSACRYVVGDWDGSAFTPLTTPTPVLRAGAGRDFCAATSCDDAPMGRRVLIGRMTNEEYAADVPTRAWSGALSAPRRIGLVRARQGLRLVQQPVDELAGLHTVTRTVENCPIGSGFNPLGSLGGRAADIEAELEVSSFDGAHAVTLQVCCGGERHTDIVWRPAERTLTVDRSESGDTEFSDGFATPSEAPGVPTESVVRSDSAAVAVKWPESTLGGVRRVWMRILVDSSSVEIFSPDGLTSVTSAVFPGSGATGLRLSADAGPARVVSVRVSSMEPVDPE